MLDYLFSTLIFIVMVYNSPILLLEQVYKSTGLRIEMAGKQTNGEKIILYLFETIISTLVYLGILFIVKSKS